MQGDNILLRTGRLFGGVRSRVHGILYCIFKRVEAN